VYQHRRYGTEGRALDPSEGATLGTLDGAIDGFIDGSRVGCPEKATVGTVLGLMVGDLVGANVGNGVVGMGATSGSSSIVLTSKRSTISVSSSPVSSLNLATGILLPSREVRCWHLSLLGIRRRRYFQEV